MGEREREMQAEYICELTLCHLKSKNSSGKLNHSFLWNQQRSVCGCGCEKASEGILRANNTIRVC